LSRSSPSKRIEILRQFTLYPSGDRNLRLDKLVPYNNWETNS
jgi:hypothetical protein